MKIVKLDEVEPHPWLNGGGITRDLLAWPTATDWQLRISVAEVTRDGPFSAYPGVERWFVIVQGAGVVLHFGDDDRRLAHETPPLRFDGIAAPGCTLIDGATRDLNLLVRKDAGQGEIQPVSAGVEWRSPAPLRAVFTLYPAELRIDGLPVAALPSAALAWHHDAADGRWELVPDESRTRAWWLSFTAQRA